MTLREAAQQALEALEDMLGWQSLAPQTIQESAKGRAAALRAALAEPEDWELRRLREELERCKQTCAAISEAWREEAALAEPVQEQVALLQEREACAQIADAHASIEGIAQRIAAEIRGQQ